MNQFTDHVTRLITQMVEEFQSKKQRKNISSRIKRGRSRSSSDDFEEYLADLFAKLLPNDISILVDYPLSYKKVPGEKVKTIYPDIVFVKGKYLLGIVEAKIDVGYLRGHWASRRKRDIARLISDGTVKIDDTLFQVAKRLSFGCILLSERNHAKRLPSLRKAVENVFALIHKEHVHPNDDSLVVKGAKSAFTAAIIKDQAINNEWDRLQSFITSISRTK